MPLRLSEPCTALLNSWDAALRARSGAPGLLLAVSGGPDSLALLLAAAQLQDAGLLTGRRRIVVATVDHALRAASAEEAVGVASICREIGFEHRTLLWERGGSAPRGNLQAAAREARYRLLAAEAQRQGAGLVATGHHLDDQIETCGLASSRGASGPALGGMRAWRDLAPGLVLLRPFLDLRRRTLSEALKQTGWDVADDPSNHDDRFARVRLRKAFEREDASAIEVALAAAIKARKEQDTADSIELSALFSDCQLAVRRDGVIDLFGTKTFGLSLLSRCLTAAGGGVYPPPKDASKRLARDIETRESGVATLNGCRVEWSRERIRFSREFGRKGPLSIHRLQMGRSDLFDNRFDILHVAEAANDHVLMALGHLGRGNPIEQTLPIVVNGEGSPVAIHPDIRLKRRENVAFLNVSCRVDWRLRADLVLPDRVSLTAGLQNAANRGEPVGKDFADTYLP